MKTEMRQLSCGNCGNGVNGKPINLFEVRIYQSHKISELHIECANCLSVIIIRPTPVSLDIDWGEHSDRILCPMNELKPEVMPLHKSS